MARPTYDKRPLPYGAGSTRGMSQRHYEAIADTLRNALDTIECNFSGREEAKAVAREQTKRIIAMLANRFQSGNDRFSDTSFVNAATDAARANQLAANIPED